MSLLSKVQYKHNNHNVQLSNTDTIKLTVFGNNVTIPNKKYTRQSLLDTLLGNQSLTWNEYLYASDNESLDLTQYIKLGHVETTYTPLVQNYTRKYKLNMRIHSLDDSELNKRVSQLKTSNKKQKTTKRNKRNYNKHNENQSNWFSWLLTLFVLFVMVIAIA